MKLFERGFAAGCLMGVGLGSIWLIATGLGFQTLHAAELAGTKFEDRVTLAGSELQLNGLGLRSLFIIRAYVAGLYVPARSANAGELLAQKGPRRLSLKMLMDTSAERMTKALNDGLRNNHDEHQMAAMKGQVDQLVATIATVGTAKKGDTVDIDLVGEGTRISLNGQQKGAPIAGDEFYAAILRVFLGAKPADRDLKKGLLGAR
jgi:Chalcone isomerase-like